jgi:predicted nucleotidyltransferase
MAYITKRGDRQWQARIRRKGHSVTETFETKARAEAWARQVESDIDAARYHSVSAEVERVTLNEALDGMDLIAYAGLQVELSDALGISVDLVERDALRPRLAPHVLAEVIPL